MGTGRARERPDVKLVRMSLPSAKSRRSGGPALTQNGANPSACVLRRGGVSRRNYRPIAPSGAQSHKRNDPPYILQTSGMPHGHLAGSANRDARASVPLPRSPSSPGASRLGCPGLPINPEQHPRYCEGGRHHHDRGKVTFHRRCDRLSWRPSLDRYRLVSSAVDLKFLPSWPRVGSGTSNSKTALES